ncbi:hypothetical protein PUNSTDRAFT_130963 [Punctularia strigosozonata HHB-11173 SS5]|uniref:uncharacterized protein n=1 Tax=Punctularia strigosozonata (strain HHB-11173) TaxID=741275 RepID=UPI00044164F9|nr:uncharacterized protein PUNSTDRAFT_130963 [Punctularia strigosozonata HHB-11173 SS5]EIN12715.1 hypothetical protein PUNSTDRAFT_130963 [Punctularia strigosozonata HHB-11173 SS5]
MSNNTYPEHPRSKVKRLANRGAYDYATIHSIIASCPVLHVSFTPDGTDPFPTILPMIGALGSFRSPSTPLSDGPLDLYLHGWVSARLMHLAGSPEEEDGLPICVAGTQVDGYVLALSPFHHSLNYRSAVIHGYLTVVTDPQEKIYGMELITNHIVPDRWANSRGPPTNGELHSTAVLRVRIESASAKVRTGGPSEDRNDEADEAVRGAFWTGVIPTWQALGEPLPAAENRVDVPPHVRDFVERTNVGGPRLAKESVSKTVAKKA